MANPAVHEPKPRATALDRRREGRSERNGWAGRGAEGRSGGGTVSRKGWGLFLAISLLWGVPYFFIKLAVVALDPTEVAFDRLVGAAAILVPLAARGGALRPVLRRWPVVTALAAVQMAGPFVLIGYGERHLPSSLTSLLIAAEPLLVAVLARFVDPREAVRGLRWLGLAVGMAGTALLLGGDLAGSPSGFTGAVLVLLATTGYAVGALALRRPPFVHLPALGLVAVQCLAASVLLAPLAAAHLPAHLPGPGVWLSLAVLALPCTAVAWLIFFALVAEVGASRAAVFTYVNPVVAVLLGVGLLHEPLRPGLAVGFALIAVGSWLATGGVRQPVTPLAAPVGAGGGGRGERTPPP